MSLRAALDGLAQGLELALVSVRKLIDESDPDEWVGQEHSPLGRRRHCELARGGAFPSARRVHGHWLVRRKDLDAFIESHARPSSEKASDAEDIAAELAFRAPTKGGRKRP